jgi:hypothetical protein
MGDNRPKRNMMKKIYTLSLTLVMIGIIPSINAQGFLQKLGQAIFSVAAGAAESYVGSALNEQDRKAWKDISNDINDGLGLDNNYANAGNKLQEGKTRDAVVDMGVTAASNSGKTSLITMSKTVKAQNDYVNNVSSGMDEETARGIAAKQISDILLDDMEERERIAAEKRREEEKDYNNRINEDIYQRVEIVEPVNKNESENIVEQQQYVDLGLPSGTLWKKKNEKDLYEYQDAVSQFGNQIPTKKQWEELMNHCQWQLTNNGYRVVGPNGNSIDLAEDGFIMCDQTEKLSVGGLGIYISSTSSDEEEFYWSLVISANKRFGDDISDCWKKSVRLVR